MKNNENWVVTGASGGIGAILVRKLLEKGCRVAAITRTPEVVLSRHAGAENLMVLSNDISDEQSVLEAKAAILERFGRVDVVVCAAGYGLRGAIEEVSDAEARKIFDVNVFGTLNMCRNFVPDLREQGGGYVITFACVDSVTTTPYNAVAHATKYAVDAFTEALNKEAGQFGISAICVKSGPMRTDYIANKQTAAQELDDYAAVRANNAAAEAAQKGHEKADPEKVADLLIELTSGKETPPRNLYLTHESVELAREKWHFLEDEFEEWKWATLCVDFPREECYHGKRS